MIRANSVWLHRLAMLTAFATFLLIVVGALVVGHDAGLSVPDWPLSYGKLMPQMDGNIFYEHSHRMIAGLVGALMTILAIWLWKAESRSWVRWLGGVALFAVLLQAILGGITVIYLLPVPVLIAHASLAQTFFCLTICLAVCTGSLWNSPSHISEDFSSFRRLALHTTAAVFIQLVLGAALRHKAMTVASHMGWAFVVAGFILTLFYQGISRLPKQERALRNLTALAGGLVFVQVALGFASYFIRLSTKGSLVPDRGMVHVTTTHVGVGALLLGTSLTITLLAFRRLPGTHSIVAYSANPHKTTA